MEQPYWCTFVVHQHGGRKIVYLLWPSRRLIVCTEETGIYIRTFPNTLTSNMAKYHEIIMCFFDKCHARHNSEILRWFPEEAGYSAEKGYTDINLSPALMSNEDKNISGFRKMMTSRTSQESAGW